MIFVAKAARNPFILKLSSYAEQRASPAIIGINERNVYNPVRSPIKAHDMNTVNKGAELLIVSVNDTATNFRATSPRTTVINLKINKE